MGADIGTSHLADRNSKITNCVAIVDERMYVTGLETSRTAAPSVSPPLVVPHNSDDTTLETIPSVLSDNILTNPWVLTGVVLVVGSGTIVMLRRRRKRKGGKR
jgi:hypothetical protein